MTDLLNIMLSRRSHRRYTDELISDDELHQILVAGLCAPSSNNRKSARFIVVKDRDVLLSLSKAKTSGGQMLKQAACAIVVYGDTAVSDAWIEDCSLAMIQMHLMADAMGLGSCWVQMRGRSNEHESADVTIKQLLSLKETDSVEAVLSLGHVDKKLEGYDMSQFDTNSIRII